jgi:hypothetical protein
VPVLRDGVNGKKEEGRRKKGEFEKPRKGKVFASPFFLLPSTFFVDKLSP